MRIGGIPRLRRTGGPVSVGAGAGTSDGGSGETCAIGPVCRATNAHQPHSAAYTAYTSPNGSFSSVKELAFKVGPADGADTFLSPYALVAFELDTHPGLGQADGGQFAGTYLELGAAPRWIGEPADVFFPIRVGLSLSNYYELAGEDHTFGFLSLGAHAEVPIARRGNYGLWNVHGGVDFYSLGDTPEAFNAGDQTKLVAFVGIGFTY